MERRDKGEELLLRKKKYHIDERGSEGYIRLSEAILDAAKKDYENNLLILKQHPFDKKAQYEIELIEQFYHSPLFGAMVSVNPEMVIKKQREKVGV